MRMYGEVPHPPLRSPAMCLQKLCTGAKATPKRKKREKETKKCKKREKETKKRKKKTRSEYAEIERKRAATRRENGTKMGPKKGSFNAQH